MKKFFNWSFAAAFVAVAFVVSACSDDDVKPEKPTTPEETIIEEPPVDHIDYVYAAFNEQINRKWVASTSQPGGGIARMSDGTAQWGTGADARHRHPGCNRDGAGLRCDLQRETPGRRPGAARNRPGRWLIRRRPRGPARRAG